MDEMQKVATGVVLYWHQGHGNLQKRISSLNAAVKAARLRAKFVQTDDVSGWVGRDAAIAKEFRREIGRACIQGWVENEIASVEGVICRYRDVPLLTRLLRWVRRRPIA